MKRMLTATAAIILMSLIAFSAVHFLDTTNADPSSQNKALTNKREIPPMKPLDFSAVFKKLGYTAENITTISPDLLRRILAESMANHQYTENASLQMTAQSKNLYDVISQGGPFTLPDSKATSGANPLTSGTKAAIIAACWDYAGGDMDLWNVQSEYNDLLMTVQSNGGYTHTYVLTNTADTWSNIFYTVQTAFASGYDNIDLYLMGHGAYEQHWIFPPFYYVMESMYCPYDAISYTPPHTYSTVVDKGFWDYYIGYYSSPFNRDMSSLRLSFVSACDGWLFKNYVLNVNGAYSHNRAVIAADGTVYDGYSWHFMDWFSMDWYGNNQDSHQAFDMATANAGSDSPGVPYSYQDTGSGVWK